MAGNLRSRLARLREAAPKDSLAACPGPHPRDEGHGEALEASERPTILAGWSRLDDFLWTRSVDIAGDYAPAGAPEAGEAELALFSPRLAGLRASLGDVAFFDLETTGLSGASGTVAFLAAIGRIGAPGAISVRQYFLADFPGEPAFVGAVRAELERASCVASYNGSAFDLPLFAVRCAMCGSGQLKAMPHADALHATRRLWKRALGDCSLSTVESRLLGLERHGDIDGGDIPDVWFGFLKGGREEDLGRVFEHNALDVSSLARLFCLITAAARDGEAALADAAGLAALVGRTDRSRAESILRRAVEAGDERAVRPLMRVYWKTGRREERLDLAPLLGDDPAGLLLKSIYEERRRGDARAALALAEAAVREAPAGSALEARAKRRAERLSRRPETS